MDIRIHEKGPNKMKNKLAMGWVIPMTAVLLASCGGNGSGSGKEGSGAPEGAVKPADQPVTLVVNNGVNSDDQERFMQDYGNAIKKKFPHVTLEYHPSAALKDRVTAQETIDIVYTSIGLTPSQLMEFGLQYDISELIKKNQYDLNRLEPSTVKMQQQLADGGMYGLPVHTTTLALYYNKDIFDKFGAPYPKDGMTWDELYELTKKVSRTEGGVMYRGFSMSFPHMMRLNQQSLPYLESKTNKVLYGSDNFKQMTENLTRFFRLPGNEGDSDTAVLSKQVNLFIKDKTLAMLAHLTTSMREPAMREAFKTMNWDVVSLPYLKESPGLGPQSYPTFFYVSATSKHKDAAFQVIAYLTSEEFQLEQSKKGIPSILKSPEVMKAYAQDDEYSAGKNRKGMIPEKYADPALYTKYSSAAEAGLLTALSRISQGQEDTNTALRVATETAEKAIKELQAK
jgi:multiple sugar transport system substrate-binding protein